MATADRESAAIDGVVMAYSGFSGLAMRLNIASNTILLLWTLTRAALMWRTPVIP
jgi:hypothetical protein